MDNIHADSTKKDEKVINKNSSFDENYRQYLPLIVFAEAIMVLSIIVHILIIVFKQERYSLIHYLFITISILAISMFIIALATRKRWAFYYGLPLLLLYIIMMVAFMVLHLISLIWIAPLMLMVLVFLILVLLETLFK